MIRLFALTFLTLLSVISALYSQKPLRVGVEAGLKFEDFRHSDPYGNLKTPFSSGFPVMGITVAHQFHRNFEVETGYNYVEYLQNFRIFGEGALVQAGMSRGRITYHQIPLRLRALVTTKNGFFRAFTQIGYSLAFSSDWNNPQEYELQTVFGVPFNQGTPETVIKVSYDYSGSRLFHLLEGGLGVEMMLGKGLSLNWIFGYHLGTQKIIEGDVLFSGSAPLNREGKVWSNGGYLRSTFGIRYDIAPGLVRKS